MEHGPDALCVLYHMEASSIEFQRVRDGEVVASVPLAHRLISGASQGNMIVTIGHTPCSMIIINDRHAPEVQQLLVLPHRSSAVAISPTRTLIATLLGDGLTPH